MAIVMATRARIATRGLEIMSVLAVANGVATIGIGTKKIMEHLLLGIKNQRHILQAKQCGKQKLKPMTRQPIASGSQKLKRRTIRRTQWTNHLP